MGRILGYAMAYPDHPLGPPVVLKCDRTNIVCNCTVSSVLDAHLQPNVRAICVRAICVLFVSTYATVFFFAFFRERSSLLWRSWS